MIQFDPVAIFVVTGGEKADTVVAGVVAAGLDEGAVGNEGAGGTPNVGMDKERPKGVGRDVVEKRVGRTIGVEYFVVRAADAGGER